MEAERIAKIDVLQPGAKGVFETASCTIEYEVLGNGRVRVGNIVNPRPEAAVVLFKNEELDPEKLAAWQGGEFGPEDEEFPIQVVHAFLGGAFGYAPQLEVGQFL